MGTGGSAPRKPPTCAMTRPPGHRGQSRDAKTVKLIRECDLVRRRGTTTLSVEALADPGGDGAGHGGSGAAAAAAGGRWAHAAGYAPLELIGEDLAPGSPGAQRPGA